MKYTANSRINKVTIWFPRKINKIDKYLQDKSRNNINNTKYQYKNKECVTTIKPTVIKRKYYK